jgi:hypothetical protein
MYTIIIINFLLIFTVYLAALILTVTVMKLWVKSKKKSLDHNFNNILNGFIESR